MVDNVYKELEELFFQNSIKYSSLIKEYLENKDLKTLQKLRDVRFIMNEVSHAAKFIAAESGKTLQGQIANWSADGGGFSGGGASGGW